MSKLTSRRRQGPTGQGRKSAVEAVMDTLPGMTQSRKVADVGPGRKSLAERTDVHCNSGCQCTWSDRNHPIQLIERLFTGMQDVGPESYSENNNRKELSRIDPVVRCAFAHSCTHVWALAEDHKMHGLQLRAVHADLTAPCASFCI